MGQGTKPEAWESERPGVFRRRILVIRPPRHKAILALGHAVKKETERSGCVGSAAGRSLRPETRVRFEFWDGSALGPLDSPGVVTLRSTEAIRHILWAPGELGLSRAYVAGALDVEGDLYETLRVLEDSVQDARIGMKAMPSLWTGAVKLGLFGGPPQRPAKRHGQRGRLHSRSRDQRLCRTTTTWATTSIGRCSGPQ